MNINITLNHGPVNIELDADSEEDYEQEVLNIAEFLEEHDEELDVLTGLTQSQPHGRGESTSGGDTKQAELDRQEEVTDQSPKTNTPPAAGPEATGKFASISRRVGVDERALERLFDMPDEDSEVPALILEELEDGAEALGDSRLERQARAALMLLYIWEDVRDVEKVYSSDLGDALHMSGIDPEKMANMYSAFDGDADTYFERHGSGGPYSGVSLTRRGERAAIDEIQKITEET